MSIVYAPLRALIPLFIGLTLLGLSSSTGYTQQYVTINEVPDYQWYVGCFGTATGNLFGFWDRHGFPNFYNGTANGGVAPLNSYGSNQDIRNMWASEGHRQDYYDPAPRIDQAHLTSYESTAPDPYLAAQREEHQPDCIGDFIGLSQNKWTNMNGECDGNIDAYTFVYWDTRGVRRLNYTPPAKSGPPVDIQSGLRAWSQYCGYSADVFTQLTDFNPSTPAGQGFTFEDLKTEIDQGYPVLVFLQRYGYYSRPMAGMDHANPEIHGMLVYGYSVGGDGSRWAIYRTSWASGDGISSPWNADNWQAGMPVRGVIGYRPKPKVTRFTRAHGQITLEWDGPSSTIYDQVSSQTHTPHWYVVEKSTSLNPSGFQPVSQATTQRSITIPDDNTGSTAFFRISLEHR